VEYVIACQKLDLIFEILRGRVQRKAKPTFARLGGVFEAMNIHGSVLLIVDAKKERERREAAELVSAK